MSPVSDHSSKLVDWEVCARPLKLGSISGDVHMVKEFDDGLLMSAIDGIGHGEPARVAAQTAADILRQHAAKPALWIVNRCHEALAVTRGAVMTMVWFRHTARCLEWLGIGNVECFLVREGSNRKRNYQGVVLRRGVVGFQLPQLQIETIPVFPGDVIALATDGVRANFPQHINIHQTPACIAKQIMDHCWKGNDDALILAGRFLGGLGHEQETE